MPIFSVTVGINYPPTVRNSTLEILEERNS